MRDQGRRLDPRQEIEDVNFVTRLPDPDGIFGGGRHALQLPEPFDLLRRAVWKIQRAERLHERRMGVAPAMTNKSQVGGGLPLICDRLSLGSAKGVGTVKDKLRDATGVFGRVGDCNGGALRDAE